VIACAARLSAQAVTGAAIAGRVVTTDSTPLDQAIVRVTNTSNGERWQTTTGARGGYFLNYLSVGGPYRVEVRAVGYQPAKRDSIALDLGQRLTLNFTLAPAAIELQEIAVTGAHDARSIAARTGPSQVISDSLIARLPVSRRDYTDLARLSPQVSRSVNGGLSFAGQHDRFNSIQIDGTNNSDPFGRSFSGNGTPGWAVGLTAFTPEAVKEVQVLSAPFDVRYGGFAGGLVNAVSRSGSNRVEGSVLGYFEAAELSGTDSTGSRGEDFSRREFAMQPRTRMWWHNRYLFLSLPPQGDRSPRPESATRAWLASRISCVGTASSREASRRHRPVLRAGASSPRLRRSLG
jgi:hypothetical protein